MRTFLFRTICAIVLLFLVTMVSEGTLIAVAEFPVRLEAVSNNHCTPDSAQSCPLPCTIPVCPLCICVISDTVQQVEMQASFQITVFEFPDVVGSIPDPYASDIFHPPRERSGVAVLVRRAV
jgi:hypothetical protein